MYPFPYVRKRAVLDPFDRLCCRHRHVTVHPSAATTITASATIAKARAKTTDIADAAVVAAAKSSTVTNAMPGRRPPNKAKADAK